MLLITTANRWPTEPYYCHKEMLDSLAEHPLTILGQNQPWDGLMTKPRLLRTFLRSAEALKGGPGQCVMVFDAFDCVFAKHPVVIEAEWRMLGTPFIIGGERALFPPDLGEKNFPQCASTYRFPNSGFIISTHADLLALLDAMNLEDIPGDRQVGDVMIHENDQFHYQRMFLVQPVPMRIDSETRFVWNLCDVKMESMDFTGPIPRNIETGNCPGVFHANGGAKDKAEFMKVLTHLKLR